MVSGLPVTMARSGSAMPATASISWRAFRYPLHATRDRICPAAPGCWSRGRAPDRYASAIDPEGVGAHTSADGREVLTWERFGEANRALAQQVADSGYQPTIILGVARGGLLPAAAIAYSLDVKNVFTMNIEFYTGVDERLEFPVMLPPLLNAVDLAGARVLVADDVADTGATLKLVMDFCAEHVADVRCAVIYEKSRSVVKCQYVWGRTDRWINFPWSTPPPVVS